MNAKYVNGMPLARQEREFPRYGLNLSAETMANWIIQCAERYLQPFYGLIKEEFLQGRYAHGDATRVQYHRNCAYEWTEAIQLSLTYDGKNERFRCVSGK